MSLKIITLALIATTFIGCVSRPADVQRKVFHEITLQELKGKKFEVIFAKKEQAESLEFRKHANTAAEYLSRKGMCDVDGSKEKADFVVALDFTMTGENRLNIESSPIFTTTTGSISRPATIQQVGTSTHSKNYVEYTRTLIIRIFTAEAWANTNRIPVFEAEAFSVGRQRDTTTLVPSLIDALLFDFPAPSGTSNSISRQPQEK